MHGRKKGLRGVLPYVLTAMLICGIISPCIPAGTAMAEGETVLAWSGDWHHYCIDGSGYARNTASTKNDKYRRVNTAECLNSGERAILFWAMLSFKATYCHDAAAAGRIAAINQGAAAAGLKPIGTGVSEADLKGVLHSSNVRAKYDWLDAAAAHGEEYLKLAGFLSGSSQTGSKKQIPALLQNALSLEKAAQAAAADGGYVLDFDSSGKDGDFLAKVPAKWSSDGISWSAESANGWKMQKSSSQIRLTNPDPKAQPVYLKFDPSGTDYASSSGGFGSPDECYCSMLQVWKCVECAGTHATGGKRHPLENHQRTIWMELRDMPECAYYAATGRGGEPGEGGELQFQIYRHEEDMEADYLVQLYKYDYETGMPLQGAVFDLYERFDDKDRVQQGSGGHGEICAEQMKHEPVLWGGFRLAASVRTDQAGHASYRLEKGYRYDKTFCDGHPAPAFGSASEEDEGGDGEEEDEYVEGHEEAGDGGEADGEGTGADADNAELAKEWLDCAAACQDRAESGNHFHWIMDDVDGDAIEAAASSGEGVDAGCTESADAEKAYEESGCKRDCEETYKAFISMRYSYTFVEKEAREGYVLHGLHGEDAPVEIITTDSSQNGAHGTFGGNLKPQAFTGASGSGRAGDMDKDFSTVGRASVLQGESRLFEEAFELALHSGSRGEEVEKGPSDRYSHGGGKEGEEEAWRVYDHRTEGEIHVNKRDMALQKGERDGYSSYGDTQGDAVLEGAVYGLFAADDLVHPDGATGVVFRQNDLVATAATDKEGNASFTAITEAPGHTYDYKTGLVTAVKEGRHEDFETKSGNRWIGRPLLLGNYYVKELSRSEGYELSVNGQNDPVSNYGYSTEVTVPRGRGAAAVTRAPYVELQSSGEDEDTMANVINFAVTSQGTGDQGYDIALNHFPKGSRLYRKDSSTREQQVEAATGQKEKKYLFDPWGRPVCQRADADNTYPKRNPDGSFVTEESAVNAVISSMGAGAVQTVDENVVGEILEHNPDGGDDWEGNSRPLAAGGGEGPQFLYIKMKVEEALRACGFETPKRVKTVGEGTGEGGGFEYSGRTKGIYNQGVCQGETDAQGLSGVSPGGTAAKTVYGHPVVTVEIPRQRPDGSQATVADAIWSLMDFYGQNPWYNFGGVHGCKETDNGWRFWLYAGVKGNPANFVVPGDRGEEPVIYHRIPWMPESREESPRWIYVKYGGEPSEDAFGTYEEFRSWQTLGQERYCATLIPEAKALGDGTIQAKTIEQNACYRKGEILQDLDGSPLQAFEWVDVMGMVTQIQEIDTWTEIPVADKNGNLVGHGAGRFVDAYGAARDDEQNALTLTYKLVLPQTDITLTQKDIDKLPPDFGYGVGDAMGFGGYVLGVLDAGVQVYLDYESQTVAGSGLYVKPVSLVYPGQESVFQDGAAKPGEGTRKTPLVVWERVIGQSVKVLKSVTDGVMDNFRFKIYLKSNLERLYRDEDGNVTWVDRNGEAVEPIQANERYPAQVPKIYTKAGAAPVLETDGENYNYAKFFDAVSVANGDKWRDASPSFTSHRPLGNGANRSLAAEENAAASDRVRQFAIDWYLDQEVEKLMQAGDMAEDESEKEGRKAGGIGMTYSDQLYDQALWEAIKKARDYLKPFFAYDLDQIYAVRWDSEDGGGKDGDDTTLSADGKEARWCSGISSVLPYGVYVIAEQQPRYASLDDLKNRHYDVDVPKEIRIPEVYESYEGAVKTPKTMNGYYAYRREISPEDVASRYQIRWPDRTEGKAQARDGEYSHALVPWSLARPGREEADAKPLESGESSYHGFAYGTFADEPYKSGLRIEKLDAETFENILHDGAIFRIYRASRDDSRHGTGEVKTYEEKTLLTGSREFLEGMGASDIARVAREVMGAGELYRGYVPPGTPACTEGDQVILTDGCGGKVGDFRACTTTRDGVMEDAEGEGWSHGIYGDQNAGYLETPQNLDAGAYVLVEIKPPAGYARTKPIALELYSDEVSYCKHGDAQDRVLAAIYRREQETGDVVADGSNERGDLARLYIENVPIRLKVEKKKSSDVQVTYQVNGRVDGSWAEIGGNPDYEYAWRYGRYLGYGWKKGTLEYLKQQRDAGARVEIVYRGGVFAGYGYVTTDAEKWEEENPYVAGARMTLYEGLELKPSGEGGDRGFEGLVVKRSFTGNVTRVYVKEGYAGTRTEFVNCKEKQVTEKQEASMGKNVDGIWDAVAVERPDTDILYYDLGDLDVFARRRIDGVTVEYGYDISHNLVELGQLEEDRNTMVRTDREHSIFAFKGGVPYLELTGGDFTKMSYEPGDKILTVPKDALVYHVDRDGNRDALVDPDTGIAYVKAEGTGAIYVWPVAVTKDRSGRRIGVDKIPTSRVAEAGEHRESGYLTGSWKPEKGEESHRMVTVIPNSRNENMEGEAICHENSGRFDKFLRPVVDGHGLPIYFSASGERYERESSIYDRDGDLVRKKSSDLFREYQKASYLAEASDGTDNQREPICHRLGENYLVENTWITGEESPNDPFDTQMTEGQADLLKRVPAGVYIMEELMAPEGYVKGLPVGLTIEETTEIQAAGMEDDSTKVLIQKLDGTETCQYDVLNMNVVDRCGNHPKTGTLQEGKGGFGHGQAEGAELALFETEMQGGDAVAKKTGKAVLTWKNGREPLYVEGLAEGSYLLEETKTPEGFVTASPMPVDVKSTGQVQIFTMFNDHTKVEFEKYTMERGDRILVGGAGFALYEAVTDENGQVVFADGKPEYDRDKPVDTWVSNDGSEYRGFMDAFEEMYRDYGTSGRRVSWSAGGKDYEAEYVSHEQIDASVAGAGQSLFPTTATVRFQTMEGKEIRITAYQQQENRQGRQFVYEYQFDYTKLPNVNNHAVSYTTVEGMRRMDYLPVGKHFVLVETRPPKGYGAAEDRVIAIEDTAQVQRHGIFNQESTLLISKCARTEQEAVNGPKELSGARMALYRADENGEFVREPQYLTAEWVSGLDGVYTETDQINGRIPEGYKKGDKRPHELKLLPTGIYYLAEQKSPDYYTLMDPVRIVHDQNQQIQMVRAWNEVVSGELEIVKTDKEGKLLPGAVFELTAYAGMERKPVLERVVSAWDGKVRISDLPVGERSKDGEILPYKYRLRELTPPQGYASDMQVHTFWFEPGSGGASWGSGQSAETTVRIENEKTRIYIRKKDFDSPEQWVAGAQLAVYPVTGRDEHGNYVYDMDRPEDVWITGPEDGHMLEGLTAGGTYMLLEEHAPEGYERMKPHVFTLSSDGRKICAVSGQMGVLTVNHDEESDVIRSVEVQGRYGVSVQMELRSEAGDVVAAWTGGGGGHTLKESDGIRDKEVFVLTETTVYSDGSREVTRRTTRRCHLSEEGTWMIPDRGVDHVRMSLTRRDGTEIQSWRPSQAMPRMEVADLQETSVFQKGQEYQLQETTCYSDGSVRDSYRMKFFLGDGGSIEGVAVMDKRQEVWVSKRDLADQRELEGALMQVRKADGTVLEAWISGKQPHLLERACAPGETYLLYEKSAPDGYGYGEAISFQVAEGECVNQVIFEDAKTHVVVSKKGVDGQEEIPGAKMQILGEDGVVAESWISGEEPYEIKGKLEAGKSYLLHEDAPPDGYGYGKDISFCVSLDGSTDRVEMRDAQTHVEISKTDGTGDRELSGAKMEVADEAGNVIAQWTSAQEPHQLVGVLNAGGTYILRELTAPDGYACGTDVKFTVSRDGSVDHVVMRDEVTRVKIVKTDRETGLALAGASLELLTLDGAVAEAWISTEEPHVLEGKLRAGQTYLIREKSAPSGYLKLEQDVRFTVLRDARTLTVEVANQKRQSHPGPSPDVPAKGKEKGPEPEFEKTGKVHANYWSVMEAHGRDSYQTFTNLDFPKMGDRNGMADVRVWLAVAITGAVGLWAAWAVKKQKPKGKPWVLLLFCLPIALALAVPAFAETVEVQAEGRLVVTGDVYLEESLLPEVLPDVYSYGDAEYVRQSYQVVTAMTEEGVKEVEETIIYKEVEQIDTLPETAEITVEDLRYGTEYKKRFPVRDAQFYNWKWIPGFELPITVEEADAQTYDLNGVLVPAQEEHPFAGYENELLALALINPDYYRIDQVRWTGGPWLGEDQKVYRNALATGEKYVADCRAVYAGTAVLEPVQGVAWQAVYQKKAEETEPEGSPEEAWELHALEIPDAASHEEEAAGRASIWLSIRLRQVVLSAGLVLLLLPLVFLFIRKHQKRHNSLKK